MGCEEEIIECQVCGGINDVKELFDLPGDPLDYDITICEECALKKALYYYWKKY